METEEIIQQLNQRFAAPLPEFYKRRIIFWHDEEQEFASQLDEIVLDQAKVVELNDNNLYEIKKLICADDLESNYLIYTPLTFDKDDDNWLINVELYSEEFRADLQSSWIEEMGLPVTTATREAVKKYKKFFGAKDRRAKVAALPGPITNTSQIQQAIMAAICGEHDFRTETILQEVLVDGCYKETNTIYQNFVNYGLEDAFWSMAEKATGYSDEDDPQLDQLAIHVLLTASTRTMHKDCLLGLDNYISESHQSYCYDFISDWLHSIDNGELYQIARFVEEEVQLPQRLSNVPIEELMNTDCFPCINKCILQSLMTEICNEIIQIDKIRSTVEKRRTLAWYEQVSCYYEGILQVANMHEFYLDHANGFHTVEPEKVWKEYTTDFYRMDTYYRLFQRNFQEGLSTSEELLDDLYKQVADQVEALYVNWFLGQLSEHWTDICADQLEEYGHILEVPQQTDFYRDQVRDADNRVYVIISDALRYEVAVSLAEQLRREMQSKVTISSCEAIFPTATKFGMAALLPHKELSAEVKPNGIAILADGQSTDAPNREKVLQSANPKSVALKYEDLVQKRKAERQELVKGTDIVYIYHDTIDNIGHNSENMVFSACEDSINEIKNLVKIIVNDFGGIHILITADHGFLYTYQPLREDEKVDKTTMAHQDVEVDRRYLITKKGANPEYLLPVKFLDGNTEFDAYTPRENVRIKKKGGNSNFIHGGISLQEMVVPVITYQHLRTVSKAYKKNKEKIDTRPVELQLLSAGRKISNRTFSLNFYQKDPVGDNRSSCSYLIYFVDANGEQISDRQKIIADKTSENGQERTYRRNFNLREKRYNNQESYYLVIADESGAQAPVREEFTIDITSSGY